MTKQLFRLLFILLPTAFIAVSCDHDDYNANDLVGTWDLIYREYVVEQNGKVVTEEKGDVELGEVMFKLMEDRSYIYYDAGKWKNEGDKWSLSGSHLQIDYADGESERMLITELLTNRMKVFSSHTEENDDGTYLYKEKATYMRR